MRKFKFKSGDLVSFNVDGEKHLGKVISGGVYLDDYVLKYYYSIYDLSNGDMFCVGEDEIKLAPEQDFVERWTKAISEAFGGYNPFQGWGEDDESNR